MFELYKNKEKQHCVKCNTTWFKDFHDWGDEKQYICLNCGTLTPINMTETFINVRYRQMQYAELEHNIRHNHTVSLSKKFDIYDKITNTGEVYTFKLNNDIIAETSRVKTLKMLNRILPKQCVLSIDNIPYSEYNSLKNRLYAIFKGDKLIRIVQNSSSLIELTKMTDGNLHTFSNTRKSIYRFKDFSIFTIKLNDNFTVKSNEEVLFKSLYLQQVQARYFPEKKVATLKQQIQNETLKGDYTIEVNTQISNSNYNLIKLGLAGQYKKNNKILDNRK